MNLPSGSQCCRAVRGRLRPQCDSTLVPEILMAAAFDQNCASSRTSSRHGSTVPGPMENRRRLGKRRMGELSFGHSQPPPPLWEFENLPDLTKWKWMPPSSPESRLRQQESQQERQQEQPTPGSSLGNLIARLRQAIFPVSNTGARSDDTRNLDGEILSPGTILSGVAAEAETKIEILPIPVWDAQSTPSDVVRVGLDLLLRDLSDPDATVDVMPNLANFCITWRNGLAGGLFTGEAGSLILSGIIEGLDAQTPGSDLHLTLENVKLYLYDATIEGVSRRKKRDSAWFDHAIWSVIFRGISELRLNNTRIFTKALGSIPDSKLSSVSSGILSNLDAQIMALGGAAKHSSLGRQSSKIVAPLRRLEPAFCTDMLNTIVSRLLGYVESNDINFTRTRFALLLVLAKLPGSIRELAEVCLRLESNTDSRPISSSEICQIYLARLQSRGASELIVTLYNRVRARDDSEAYRRLSRGLCNSRQYHLATDMSELLTRLGREEGILKMVKEARKSVTAEITSMVGMAIGMNKPSLAMQVLIEFDKVGRRPDRFWRSTSGGSVLKGLVNAHGLNHKKLLETLDVVPIPYEKLQLRRRAATAMEESRTVIQGTDERPSEKQVIRIARTAMVLAHTRFISQRKAFALISVCIKYLKTWDVSIPPSIIRALIHNITRNLAEGRMGQSLRLRWFLHLLRSEFGDKTMIEAGISLKRWRDFNSRMRKRAADKKRNYVRAR